MSTLTLNGGQHILPTDIVNKIQAGTPETLTASEMATLTAEVPPLTPPDDNGKLQHASSTSTVGGIKPMNVQRCGGTSSLGDVCVDVRSKGGSGAYITQWNAVWDLPANYYDCETSYNWWGNDSTYYSWGPDCGYGAVYQYWNPNKTLKTGNAETFFVSDEGGYSGSVTFKIKS